MGERAVEDRNKLASDKYLFLVARHHPNKVVPGVRVPMISDLQDRVAALEGRIAELAQHNEELKGEKDKLANTAFAQIGLLQKQLETLQNDVIASADKGTLPTGLPSNRQIIDIVAEFYEAPVMQMIGPGRSKELITPRYVAMYLCREITGRSHPVIGRSFGNKDHSSSLYAYRTIERRLKTNDRLRDEITLLRLRIAEKFPGGSA